jgi:hypothetical protein
MDGWMSEWMDELGWVNGGRQMWWMGSGELMMESMLMAGW